MDLLKPDFGVIFWQTATMLFAIIILSKFAWKPILKIIEAREKDISSALEKASEARTMIFSVEKQKNEIIEKSHIESNKIISDAQNEKEVIIKNAKNQATKIINDALLQAKTGIERERSIVIEEIKNNVASISVQIAEQLIKGSLKNDMDHSKLIEKMLN